MPTPVPDHADAGSSRPYEKDAARPAPARRAAHTRPAPARRARAARKGFRRRAAPVDRGVGHT
ncbi:hypothetical protein [Streptomyces sp. NPDC047928]|uniref:hypothetical protein n=1 Tax=unclassified Streptomyces TaxID=2593676 RepID=UPI003713C5D7